MVSTAVEQRDDARGDDSRPVTPLLLAAGLLAAGIALSPGRVATVVSLDWVLGDMGRAVQIVRVCLVLGAAALVLWRARVSRALQSLRAREVLASAALLLVSAGATLTLAEVALRHEHYPFSGSWTPSETALARFDDTLGWSYREGLTATQPFGRQRRMVTMYFDSAGIRVDGPVHVFSRTKPSILFIGDSFTFGHGVAYEEAFPARVEQLLGGQVQSVNLGVQGYGTDQSLLALRRHMAWFNSRIVVYTYLADHIQRNDNYDRRVLYPDGNWPGTKPLFGLRADGTVFLSRHPRRIADLASLHLLQVAERAWARWGPRPDARLTTALIRELKRDCDARGIRLLVVNWPRGRAPSTATGGTSQAPAGATAVFAGTGVDVLDLGVDAPPEWATWRIPGDGHPTAAAHELAARLIARRLRLEEAPTVSAP